MRSLSRKIDFAIIFKVTKANPNGDPLNGNRPRIDYAGFGEVSDVCLKRKIRDRLLDRYRLLVKQGVDATGQGIFVQSDDNKDDDAKNLRVRAEAVLKPEIMKDRKRAIETACATWFDVRTFGQVFPFKGQKGSSKGSKKQVSDGPGDQGSETDADGVSIPVRGPVTVHSAFSVQRLDIEAIQLVKSTSLEGDGEKRQSDQMGMKHRVDHGIYVCYGSMSPQLGERTGFCDSDAQVIKEILPRLFENDASSARPDGSMQVLKVIWWQHNSRAGQYSSAKVHGTLRGNVQADGSYKLQSLAGLPCEEISGF